MPEERTIIPGEVLGEVVGGLMNFNRRTLTLRYTKQTGEVQKYSILKFDEAWNMSNNLHAQNIPEDMIIEKMRDCGYIE